MIADALGRSFKKLRLSVTRSCDLGCLYCVPDSPDGLRSSGSDSSVDQLVEMVQIIHSVSPLEHVRLTGGEPLLFRGLEKLIEGIRGIGIDLVTITTNGTMLTKKLQSLLDAGLDSLNITLDSLNEDVFKTITRGGDINQVLAGIEHAHALGVPVKLNATVLRGLNDGDVVPLLDFARKRNMMLRYIELMSMGHIRGAESQYFFSQADILAEIGKQYQVRRLERSGSMPSRFWEIEDGYRFGIIANSSDPFCDSCDRLRLGSDGTLYGCISSPVGFSLKSLLTESERERAASEVLHAALAQKQPQKFTGSDMTMRNLGG